MKNPSRSLNRRRFLETLGMAAGGLFLSRLPMGRALAQSAAPRFLLVVYFEGGWDQLLALDPRPANEARFQRIGDKPPTSGIEPNYAEAATRHPFVNQVMTATAGSGVQVRGNLSFGPAVPSSLLDHAGDLSIVRGINMETLTHEVGRRYLITGKFPRGLAPSGSSLNTVAAAQLAPKTDMANLVVGGLETYNESLPAAASGIGVASFRDLLALMKPQDGAQLPAASEAALAAFGAGDDSCGQRGFDLDGLVATFRSSQGLANKLTNPEKSALFDFKVPAPPALSELFAAFDLSTAADLNGVRARAAVAGQALVNGVATVVGVTLANGLDDHFDLATQHPPPLRDGFDALGRLIAYLKSKQVPGTAQSFWEHTSMLVFSEFSRTPLINTRDGRDHHLTSSCLLAGPGLKGNAVFGASSDNGMGFGKWSFDTGLPDENGRVLRPSDVHATLLQSMGLSHGHLSNQTPKPITALLK